MNFTFRCAIFSAFSPPYRGGYVQSLMGLVDHLRARGVDILMVTSQLDPNQPLEEHWDHLTILRIPSWNPARLNHSFPIPKPTFATLRLFFRLLREPMDIVSTQTRFFPLSFVGCFFAIFRRKPLIHTERGGSHTPLQSPLLRMIALIIDHTFGSVLVRTARLTIGVSQAAVDFTRHLGSKNTKRIPNGIDAQQWRNVEPASFPDIPHDAAVITFVGRLVYEKGVHDLLEALRDLHRGDIHTIIIGDGPYRSTLEQRAKEFQLSNVHFLGEQEPPVIQHVLRRTAIFVNPSYSEGLPRCVLEAAASGCSIIATDVGGTKELLPPIQQEFLIAPRKPGMILSHLQKLLDNPILRQTLGSESTHFIEKHFSWDTITDEYLSEIQKILSSKKSQG